MSHFWNYSQYDLYGTEFDFSSTEEALIERYKNLIIPIISWETKNWYSNSKNKWFINLSVLDKNLDPSLWAPYNDWVGKLRSLTTIEEIDNFRIELFSASIKKEIEMRKESAIKVIKSWLKSLKVEINQLEADNRDYLELINKLHDVENIILTRDKIIDHIKQKAAKNPNPNDDRDENPPPQNNPANSSSRQESNNLWKEWGDKLTIVAIVIFYFPYFKKRLGLAKSNSSSILSEQLRLLKTKTSKLFQDIKAKRVKWERDLNNFRNNFDPNFELEIAYLRIFDLANN